jgi:hypothetical protein
MAFPNTCLRGIPNNSYLVEDGSVGAHLFHFEDKPRGDGWIEQSINWEDNDGALEMILTQRKENGELQFRTGAVRIPRDELDRLSRQPTINGLFSYERNPLESNSYHGNLLLRSSIPKPTMRKIAAGIALAVSEIIKRP